MNIEELRKETIKKLEDYKEYIDQSMVEENYANLVNIAIDYDNEAQDELYLHDTLQELANLENVTDWDFEYCADECIAKLQQI